MKYTHGTFFHFVAQVLIKLYVANSELYSNTSIYIIMAGKDYSKGHMEWLQLFSKHPVRSIESVKLDECWSSVSVLNLDDWFHGAFHLLHLEWRPEYVLRSYADFMHLRSGTQKRTLIPNPKPLKVVYVWRDPDRSAPDRYNRKVNNQEELVDAMRKVPNVDMHLVRLEQLKPVEQLKMFEDAAIMVGAHGAGLVNMIYLPHCASVIEIFPYGTDLKQHPANTFVNVAHFSGKQYHPYVCTKYIDPGFETVDIRKMTTEVVLDDYIKFFRKIVEGFSTHCEVDTPMLGSQTVQMGRGTMKFAEQIDDARKK
jgi:protein O-mannose beta-1,4-N-acetylglucosaminyltransferase